ELLGDKARRSKELQDLRDNAFAGPNRTFPAHRPEYINAGLYLLDNTDLDPKVKDEIWRELSRRADLFKVQTKATIRLDDSEFVRAHILMSLHKKGCLKDESVLQNESGYQTLKK